MGAAGVVFIDRSDRRAAIETMKPLVNAMRDERKSLVIAPEGTRAPTRKLGAFKKGGFHIAIESGVPIVPRGDSQLRRHLSKGRKDFSQRHRSRGRPSRNRYKSMDGQHHQ